MKTLLDVKMKRLNNTALDNLFKLNKTPAPKQSTHKKSKNQPTPNPVTNTLTGSSPFSCAGSLAAYAVAVEGMSGEPYHDGQTSRASEQAETIRMYRSAFADQQTRDVRATSGDGAGIGDVMQRLRMRGDATYSAIV